MRIDRIPLYVVVSPALLFSVALALHEADLIDSRRGVVSGVSGDMGWVAVDRAASLEAVEIAAEIDPGALISSAIDYVAEVMEAMV